jgi:hypothetical protein
MYTFVKRSVPYPSLQVFDAPTGESPCPRRIPSDTPLQALTTLNDPVFVEAAQAMALRVWKHGGKDDRARLQLRLRALHRAQAAAQGNGDLSSLLQDEDDFLRTAPPAPCRSPRRTRRTRPRTSTWRRWRRGRWSRGCCSIWTKRLQRSESMNFAEHFLERTPQFW